MTRTRQYGVCSTCKRVYGLTKDRRTLRHLGISPAGFGTDEPCEGWGKPAEGPAPTPKTTEETL